MRAEKHNLAGLADDEEREDYSVRTSFRERLLYTRPLRDLLERADVRRFKRDCVVAGYSFDADGALQWVALACRDNGLDLRKGEDSSLDDFCKLVEKPSIELQSTNDERDAWMYKQKKVGKTHGEIKTALERDHPKWDQLDSEQAVGRAIDRYCERKQLPKLRRKAE